MGSESGFGWLGVGTMLFGAALLAYPAWWAFVKMPLAEHSWRRWEISFLIGLTALSVMAVIPVSYGSAGWMSVPPLIILLVTDYAVVHSAVATWHEVSGRRESVGTFLGFLVPLLVLVAGVVAVSFKQIAVEIHGNNPSMQGMDQPFMITFGMLAVLPPGIAASVVVRRYLRHRAVTARAEDDTEAR